MSGLSELSIDRWMKHHWPTVLSHRMDRTDVLPAKNGRRRKQVCLPNLSVFMLQNTSIGSKSTAPGNAPDTLYAKLRKALAARQKAGAELDKLVVSNCTNFFDIDVPALEKTVGAVEWDGMEDDAYRDDDKFYESQGEEYFGTEDDSIGMGYYAGEKI